MQLSTADIVNSVAEKLRKEGFSEKDIENLFSTENVLYVDAVTDSQSIDWAKENPISSYLN